MTVQSPTPMQELARATRGEIELDLVITGAKLLDVYRGIWVDGDLGMVNGRIAAFGLQGLRGKRTIDATGKWVVPGMFEAHYHAGGTHLSPARLAEELLRRGTTASVCDFQEFYVVGGIEAARSAVEASWTAGLKLYYLLPTQHFVINDLAHEARRMPIDDMTAMLDWPETVGINEPPPGPVLNNDSDIARVIDATLQRGKVFTGHAPEMSGAELQAYTSTRASSDHESRAATESWEKIGLGMRAMMRHGSAAPDMARLIELARDHPLASRYMMLVSDEIDPNDLIDVGHLDAKVRLAIEHGVDPVIAFQMVTINPAEYYRVDHEIGSLAPGRSGDAVILDDLEQVTVSAVIANGEIVPNDRLDRPATVDVRLSHPLRPSRPLTAKDFAVPATGSMARVRTIDIAEGSLISQEFVAEVPVVEGNARPDPSADILKLAVIERYEMPAYRSIGFTRGFGIRAGAVATTYMHSFYNLLVVGTEEELMARASAAVVEIGGGVAVVDGNGAIVNRWALPLVGIFSDEQAEQVRQDFNRTNEAIRSIGCEFASPLLALSFVSLATIPRLGMTHAGLYDVNEQRHINVLLEHQDASEAGN